MAPLDTSVRSRDGSGVDESAGFMRATGTSRTRILLSAAITPLITGYAAVAALFALVTVSAPRAGFSVSGVLGSACPGWLAVHQVAIGIDGQPFGMLPLGPTVGVCFVIARTAAGAAHRLGYRDPVQAAGLIVIMAATHALFGIAISLIFSSSQLGVDVLAAFFIPGGLAGISATVGVGSRSGLAGATRGRLDPLAVRGIRAGALGMAALLACGAAVFAGSIVASSSTVRALFGETAPGFGGGLGMLLLSIAYLPNAVIAGLSFIVGPGFSLGSVSVGPFTFDGGPVPAVPLLGGMPAEQAAWWPVLLGLPLVVGTLVGWSVRGIAGGAFARLRAVGVAGVLVGFGCVVLGTFAGGRLGNGPFDPVSLPVGVLSLIAFCWIVVPGSLVAWFAGPRPRLSHLLGSPEPESGVLRASVADGGGKDNEPLENLDTETDVDGVAEVGDTTDTETSDESESDAEDSEAGVADDPDSPGVTGPGEEVRTPDEQTNGVGAEQIGAELTDDPDGESAAGAGRAAPGSHEDERLPKAESDEHGQQASQD